MLGLPFVLLAIIAGNVLFSMAGFKDRNLFSKYMFQIAPIKNGEQIRMFSSGFLHADWMHLGFNMYTLYIFTPIVIHQLGDIKFVSIYIGSLLLGSILSFIFHKDEPYYSAIGASGAVSGILYASILLYPNMSLYLFFIPIPIPGYIFGIGYLLYSIYGMKNRSDTIGHDAHFGGSAAGYLMTLLFMPSLFQSSPVFVLLLAIPLVILFVLFKTGKI